MLKIGKITAARKSRAGKRGWGITLGIDVIDETGNDRHARDVIFVKDESKIPGRDEVFPMEKTDTGWRLFKQPWFKRSNEE